MSACASRRRISSSSRRTACSRPRARSKRAAAAQCTLHTHASTSSALDACGHSMCSRIQYCTHVVVHKHSKNKTCMRYASPKAVLRAHTFSRLMYSGCAAAIAPSMASRHTRRSTQEH